MMLAAIHGRSAPARAWMLARLERRSPQSVGPAEKSIILGGFNKAYNRGFYAHTLKELQAAFAASAAAFRNRDERPGEYARSVRIPDADQIQVLPSHFPVTLSTLLSRRVIQE